ncbi:MAG: hypothetical protein O3A33_12920 [Chloroflexi bacterium]|nr:hypothetical protein [Chloroflexota bacterium]
MPEKFRIANNPNIKASHNLSSWEKLASALGPGSATVPELVAICKGHDHPLGAKGFVRYCIKNGWLGSVRGDTTKTRPPKQERLKAPLKAIRSAVENTGFYIAYPTTAELKPIHKQNKNTVNCFHTKVGITHDFEKRAAAYHRTFGGEIVFKPIVHIEPARLIELEGLVKAEVSSQYNRVGTTREWFDTAERDQIVSIVMRVVSENGV